MKISHKMIIVFSIAMILLVVLLTSYSINTSLEETSAFSAVRFRNMGDTMLRQLEQQISMMDLAMEELMDNTSFMAALNQFVRDDSDDRKVGLAARNTVSQLLYRSPLVDSFYRVSIYTREGDFITSRFEKDDYLESGTDQARAVLDALPWLSQVDAQPSARHILPPHNDFLSVRRDMTVYGAVRGVIFHGKQIGYIQVSVEMAELNRIMSMVDESTIDVTAVFDDGAVLYNRAGSAAAYPENLPTGQLTDWEDNQTGLRQKVMHLRSDWLGLSLFVAQSRDITDQREQDIRWGNIRAAIIIAVPVLAIIVFISLKLTRSIRLLTRKVNQLPGDNVLQAASPDALNQTVTSPADREIYELEKVFNGMLLRLRESTLNELASREGTPQARLSALQTQINPHFIYNTLNIISAKSMESGNIDVIEICDQFAQMLRYSTDTRSRTATIADEIENVRNYLLLAKARYEENLEFSIDVPAQLGEILMPKLTLQPLVENALNHGYNGQNMKRLLSIRGWIENGRLILEIRDNGTGFSDEMLEKLQGQIHLIEAGKTVIEEQEGHIGLVNTCLRLHYYSHGAMRIRIRNENGAVVTLSLPCENERMERKTAGKD